MQWDFRELVYIGTKDNQELVGLYIVSLYDSNYSIILGVESSYFYVFSYRLVERLRNWHGKTI